MSDGTPLSAVERYEESFERWTVRRQASDPREFLTQRVFLMDMQREVTVLFEDSAFKVDCKSENVNPSRPFARPKLADVPHRGRSLNVIVASVM